MIQPNELRIGNYYINAAQVVDQVTELSRQYVSGKEFAVPYGTVNGIKLTENWLIEFGLEKQGNNDSFDEWINNDVFFWLIYKKEEQRFQYYYSPDEKFLDYVHEVQNLYFALTGKELTILAGTDDTGTA